MSADDLYQLRFVSDPQLSPDGTQVVYVCAWVDPEDRTRYRSQLMLVPFDGSSPPRPLTSGKHRDNAPRWSPDNCSIAFVSDRDNDRGQVFVLPLQGGEPRQLTSAQARRRRRRLVAQRRPHRLRRAHRHRRSGADKKARATKRANRRACASSPASTTKPTARA